MDDPNSAAAANAVAAGANFWGRVQSLRQNKFQKTQLGIEQQNADTEKARQQTSDRAQKLTEKEFEQSTLPQAQTNLKVANVGLAQAQKAEFLQSHNPVPSASQSWGQQQAQNFISQVKPATDATMQEDNARQGVSNPGGHAVPGYVRIPVPQDPEDRQLLGIPEGYTDPIWPMQEAKFQSLAPQLGERALNKANTEFSKPYDEMNPEVQAAVRESYQKNAPPGVKISDADAAMAFRTQQRLTSPLTSPGDAGMIPTSAEFDPSNPAAMKIQYTAPISGAGGSLLTPEQYKTYGEPLQKIVGENAELKTAQITSGHVASVLQYAEEPHPTVSSDKSLIMAYLKSLDPTVRVSEGTVTTVMDGMGVPEEIKNATAHLMTGSLFTPHHREWFKSAAIQNLENARKNAANSIQSQLAISGATGNPIAKGVKLPPSVLPPSRKGPGGDRSDAAASGSSSPTSEGTKKFNSLSQAEAANLPPGTEVLIFDEAKGGYRRAVSQ